MVLESVFPSEGGGGAENQVRTLSRHLDACCVPVQVIAPLEERGVPKEHDEVDGVPVWRIPFPYVRKLGAMVLLVRLAWFLLRERNRYDVIHAHIANNMAAVCSLMGRLLGKTVIVKITGALELADGFLSKDNRSPAAVIKRETLKMASWFHATSSEIQTRLLENDFPENRIRVIPNAVDLDRFAAIRDARREGTGPLTAVYVGRLVSDKGTDVLLDAWLDAFSAEDDVRLLLVGEGEQREMIETAIREQGREHQFALLGAQSDVKPFLAKADFAVLPSRYEGLSNAMLEYMAAALPVLGTRVSGTVDFIEPERSGWLVDSDDPAAFTQALRRVRATSRARLREMGQASAHTVMTRAGIDAISRRLAELYRIPTPTLRRAPQGEYG